MLPDWYCREVASFVVSLTFPYLLTSLKGRSFVICGAMCVLCLLFVLKYLRETNGKTLEEIENEIAGYSVQEMDFRENSAKRTLIPAGRLLVTLSIRRSSETDENCSPGEPPAVSLRIE